MSENISPVALEEKMKKAYLNYSLSVIVGRALPDVRDGLKPVHRRILYASRELGLTHDKSHKKSARIVGEVLGKYHPHGDAAVYNAMVRMAQPFNQRYPLIDGHGNFGSIDGDSPAAMRYTEAKLTQFSQDLLLDINKETVDFDDNFDGTLQEPEVLPTRIPNLLVNGSSGIAVGMSTSIPPHNLAEVIDGLEYILQNPNTDLEELVELIPGPDFPTGAKIIGKSGIKKAYKDGKGKITLRADTTVEKTKSGRKKQIVITELPYQTNKAKLIEDIAGLVQKGKIEEITDIRDESDQEGLRVVIELKSGTDIEIVLNRLYKYSSLQTSYRINLLALVDNRPEVMNLKTLLQHFIDFRREVITRRTEYELARARERYHILQGLKQAISELDVVISIIRSSKSRGEASDKLQERLNITEKQARAILQMRLQRLVVMEFEKIKTEISDLRKRIKKYTNILENKNTLDKVLLKELREIRERYGDSRRTEIEEEQEKAKISKQDLIKEKQAYISLSYKKQVKRNEKLENMRAGKDDYIITLVSGITYDNLLFFTDGGMVYSLPVHDIPEHHGLSTGDELSEFLQMDLDEKLIGFLCLNEKIKEKDIIMATRNGIVKKTAGSDYETTYNKIKAIKLNKGDKVIDVTAVAGDEEIMLGSSEGRTIRFAGESISSTGRNTIGSRGMKLDEEDQVIDMNIIQEDKYVVSITPGGKANRIRIEAFSPQNRNGKGLKTVQASGYRMASILSVKESDKLLMATSSGRLYTQDVIEIAETQRPGYLYKAVDLNEDDEIKDVIVLPEV